MLISITDGVDPDKADMHIKDKETLMIEIEKIIEHTRKMIEIVKSTENIDKPLHTARVSKEELAVSL